MSGLDSAGIIPRPALSGFGIEWADADRLIMSRRDELFELRPGRPPSRLGRFPQPLWKRAASLARPAQRVLRYMYYNVLPLANGELFVTFGKEVGVISVDGQLRVLALARPCRVLRGGAAIADDGSVLFGEYIENAERSPIRIYRYWPGASALDVAYTFPAGSVCHVHGLFKDPFGPGVWCAVGDKAHECRILFSADGFRSHDVVGGGDESWRAVSLQFTPDAVLYAMDAEFTQNFIHRIERGTGDRRVLQAIEGPAYYSSRRGAQLYFAVTAERAPSQQGDFAALWRVDAATDAVTRLRIFPKDRLSVRYFMAGTIDFAMGDGTHPELFFRTTALVPDNRVFAIV